MSRTSTQTAPAGIRLDTRARSKLLIFCAAGLSLFGSIYLWFGGLREEGLFVGLWVPSILSAGCLLMSEGAGRMDHE